MNDRVRAMASRFEFDYQWWTQPGHPPMWGLGTNHIDTFVVKSGSTWHAFTKDETGKYIEHWTTTKNLLEGWVNRGPALELRL